MSRSLETTEAEIGLRERLIEARRRTFDDSLPQETRALEGQRVLALSRQLMLLDGLDPDRPVTGSLGCVSATGRSKVTAEEKEIAEKAAEFLEAADGGRFYSHTVKGGP